MTEILDWTYKATEIPASYLDGEREATDAERDALAAELGLLVLSRLSSKFRIKAVAGGGYRLVGTISAALEQPCVVTLEPVASTISAAYDVEFRPEAEKGSDDEDGDVSVLSGPDFDVLERGIIPVGRIVFETLSGSLDPYPRKRDAEFKWSDPQAAGEEKLSPFAALSKLKSKD